MTKAYGEWQVKDGEQLYRSKTRYNTNTQK